jgi:hypothetical protein
MSLLGRNTKGGRHVVRLKEIAIMIGCDRVALVGLLWFTAFIVGGDVVGREIAMPGTGMVIGFLLALFGVLAWPWVLPASVDNWMHDSRA